jgi:hypothetical protein
MSTWTITNSASGKQLGTIQNKLKFVGSKIDANGEFGHYKIEGDFGNHSFTIKKDGHKVSFDLLPPLKNLMMYFSRLLKLKRRASIFMIPMV